MSGYQAIPSPIKSIENGVPSNTIHSISLRFQSTTREEVRTVPLFISKIGYFSFGMIVGCVLAGGVLNRGPDAEKKSTPQKISQNFLIDGKLFLDSLPFEEVNPLHWSPAQQRPYGKKRSDLFRTDRSPIDEKTQPLAATPLGANANPSGPHLLYHAHEASFNLLYDSSKSSSSSLSEYSLDYFLLNTGGFDAQINQAYCALATVASVLNSLRYSKRFLEKGDLKWSFSFNLPIDPAYDPYPYATQTDLLASDCVHHTVIEHGDGSASGESDRYVKGLLAPPYGLTLEQSAKLLTCHVSDEWVVNVQEADAGLSLSNMQYELKAALIDPDARVMINYDRKELGQLGGGHFSPLGAYDTSTDSFLIMDVAKYKYPPVWVGSDTLFSAMATVDKCGTWDYPKGQEQIKDTPRTPEEYLKSLELLNCKQKMRGYITLRKKR